MSAKIVCATTSNEFLEDLPINKGVDIVWKNVNYTARIKKNTRQILKNSSGICKSGEMTAIIGSSGAGKTTLLNILCCRAQNTDKVKLTGEISANGQNFNSQTFSNFAAYVMQEDLLMESMTVIEVLQFAAHLKMKGTDEQKYRKVKDVLRIMRLENCQNSLIGGAKLKGITKGEKKRTSIAFELVSDPDVIFLDEPTSGLDSFTAYHVIDVLQSYVKQENKTIICTIHQPSSEIFLKFDRLILLVEGQFIYQGPRDQCIDYFASFGFECPKLNNPADYLMSIMHGESERNRQNYKTYFEKFELNLKPVIENELQHHKTNLISNQQSEASFGTQLQILLKRNLKNVQRNPMESKARVLQSIILGLFTGIIYLSLPDPEAHQYDQRAVNDYNGAIYFLAQNLHMNTLFPIVLSLPLEKAIFLKEQDAKLYNATTYIIAKLLVESILAILCPVIFVSISYYMIGLTPNFGCFCFFILVSILQSSVGMAQGLFCGAAFRDAQTAVSVTPMMILPFMLFGGLYKNVADMPDWNGWIQWISNYRYSFEAFVRNNYAHSPFKIDVVGQLNFDFGKWNCVFLLIVLFFSFSLLSLILLKTKNQSLQ